MEFLVDSFSPRADASSCQRRAWIKRRIGKGFLEILANHGRLRDHVAIGDEHRHDAFRIDREELGPELLALQNVDVVTDPLQTFFTERETDLCRARRRSVVVELEHPFPLQPLANRRCAYLQT